MSRIGDAPRSAEAHSWRRRAKRETDPMVVVGSKSIDIATAVKRVVEYATSDDYLFGTYDAYRTNDDPSVLADGDLLAPLLLNVQVSVRSDRKLERWKPQLEQTLAQLPAIDLGAATDADIDK